MILPLKCATVNFKLVTMRLKMLILTVVTVSHADGASIRNHYLVQSKLNFGPDFGTGGQFRSDQREVPLSDGNRRLGRQDGQRNFEFGVSNYYGVSTEVTQRQFQESSNVYSRGNSFGSTQNLNSQSGYQDRSVVNNNNRNLENRFRQNNEERTNQEVLNVGQFIPTAKYESRNKLYDRSINSNNQRNSNAYGGSQPVQSNLGSEDFDAYYQSRSIESGSIRNINTEYQQKSNVHRTDEGQRFRTEYSSSQTGYNSKREQQNIRNLQQRQQNKDGFENIASYKQHFDNNNRRIVTDNVQNGRHVEYDNGNGDDASKRQTDTRQHNTKFEITIEYPSTIRPANGHDTRTILKSSSKTVTDNEVNYTESRNRYESTDMGRGVSRRVTTVVPDKVTLDDRAAFSGDRCPTNKVKVGEQCVDID